MTGKIFNLPPVVRGVLFDIDNTLYDNREFGESQIRVLIERLAAELGRPAEDVVKEVEQLRRKDARGNEGRRPSLGNTFLHYYDIPIATSVAWRAELIEPEAYLSEDPDLRNRIEALSRRAAICAVTNNPVQIGERTLRALGIGDLIPVVSGLDTVGVSKPDPRPFELALEYLALPPGEVLSVGDRYEIDLEPIIDLGGGGVLIEGREELLSILDSLIQGELR
ncbi:MAG: HAD family hydrolase [Alkalispirochaetaceae bacterium]